MDDLPKKKESEPFTLVKPKKKSRKTPVVRCNFRQYCQQLKPGRKCFFHHTKEEIESAQSGVPLASRVGLCNEARCIGEKCRFAHRVEELFCPTCNLNGHLMTDCPQKNQPVIKE